MTLIEILEAREEALDVHQVAELLRVSERHIYELAADGTLPAFRVGKAIRFDPQDVADWLRKKRRPDEQSAPRAPQKPDGPKPNHGQTRISPEHVWRNKVRSLEVVLGMGTLADGNSVKNS